MCDGVERMRKSFSPFLLIASLWAFWVLSVKQRHMKRRRLILEKLDSHFQQSQRSVPNTSIFCCCRDPLKSSWPHCLGWSNTRWEMMKDCVNAQWLCLNSWVTHVVLSCLGITDFWGWTCRGGWAFLALVGLAEIHISMILHLILYTGKLKTDVVCPVAYLCAPQIWKWSMSVNSMQQ